MSEHTAQLRQGLRRLYLVGLGSLAIVLSGAFGYVLIEHWEPIDAIYMTVITLTTVGFGEVRPLSPLGRVFTTGLISVGVIMLAYSASVVGAFFLDGTFTELLRRRRLNKVISKAHNHSIICGYGRTGRVIVERLLASRIPFVVVESDPRKVLHLVQDGIAVVEGSAHDNDILEEAGIHKAKALMACASDDAENVFIVLSARAMCPELIIASRVSVPESEAKLKRAGANWVVSPYCIAGDRLVASVYRPSFVRFLESSTHQDHGFDIWEVDIAADTAAARSTLAELDVPRLYKSQILAIRKTDGSILPNPPAETRLEPHDILLALGPTDELSRLTEDFGRSLAA